MQAPLRRDLLPSERINGLRAKTSRKNMRERVPPFQTSKPARKVDGEAAHFLCLVFEFWRGGARSRIVFLEVFAKCSLIRKSEVSHGSFCAGARTKNHKNIFVCVRPQTDFIRLVSSKLMLQERSRRPGLPF